jgi:hypothetical protein
MGPASIFDISHTNRVEKKYFPRTHCRNAANRPKGRSRVCKREKVGARAQLKQPEAAAAARAPSRQLCADSRRPGRRTTACSGLLMGAFAGNAG